MLVLVRSLTQRRNKAGPPLPKVRLVQIRASLVAADQRLNCQAEPSVPMIDGELFLRNRVSQPRLHSPESLLFEHAVVWGFGVLLHKSGQFRMPALDLT